MRSFIRAALVALSGAACVFVSHAAMAAPRQDLPARFVALPPHTAAGVQFAQNAAGARLAQWNGSFVDPTGATINYTLAGLDPSVSNQTTAITAYLIPVRMVYGATNGNRTFDPTVDRAPNGKTIVQNIVDSPMFTSRIDYVQGGTDLGTTQYIDAYQRGNLWSAVSTHPGYHTVLNVQVLATKTIKVKPSQGKVVQDYYTPGPRGLMDINAFDLQLQAFIASIRKIHPDVLPIFITDDVFLTAGGGCCIGGYHTATAPQPAGQTYAHASYINSAGSFAQDVSALSHEVGEWMLDPFVDNQVSCTDNSIMENGDPLENRPNFGSFGYPLDGFTYNLQSLVFLPYFGAPASTSVNGWYSFQNDQAGVCPGL